jgi:hypothetical protein
MNRFPLACVHNFRTALFCLALSQAAAAGTYINIDVGIIAVNNSGETIGSGGLTSAFIRQLDGAITIFTVPNAISAYPVAINNGGQVVGWYVDAGGVLHGFLRDAAGEITALDAPAAGVQLHSGTVADSINDAGQISGHYIDGSGTRHGFVRDAAGNYSTFTPPGSLYVAVSVLSQNGSASGWYQDSTSVGVGYVRDARGGITRFSVPGSDWTQTAAINASSQITGLCGLSSGKLQGFIRNADGSFVTFDFPGARTFPPVVVGIADNGDVVGYYGSGEPGGFHGFVRGAATGAITTFDDPDADHIHFDGTFPQAVSGNGTIAGFFSNPSLQGFILR